MANQIKWNFVKNDIGYEIVNSIEEVFTIQFPIDYIECVISNNGGYPKPDRFTIKENEEVFNNLINLNLQTEYNIIETYNNVKDRLVEKVIPFADDPFGNLICFDYRKGNVPTIVFWEHEKAYKDKENAIKYVCDSFTDLLNMLHEGEA